MCSMGLACGRLDEEAVGIVGDVRMHLGPTRIKKTEGSLGYGV